MAKLHSRRLVELIRETIGVPIAGAEIGVFRGENAQHLLNTFPDLILSMVDLWKQYDEGSRYYKFHSGMGKLSADEWDTVYNEAMTRTKFWANMRKVFRMESDKAADQHPDKSLCFVFIDASHLKEDFKRDLDSWLPKIRKGGLVCGHDYGGRCGDIKSTVDEMFGRRHVLTKHGMIWGVRR